MIINADLGLCLFCDSTAQDFEKATSVFPGLLLILMFFRLENPCGSNLSIWMLKTISDEMQELQSASQCANSGRAEVGSCRATKILDEKLGAFSNQVPLSDPRQLVRKSLSPT